MEGVGGKLRRDKTIGLITGNNITYLHVSNVRTYLLHENIELLTQRKWFWRKVSEVGAGGVEVVPLPLQLPLKTLIRREACLNCYSSHSLHDWTVGVYYMERSGGNGGDEDAIRVLISASSK